MSGRSARRAGPRSLSVAGDRAHGRAREPHEVVRVELDLEARRPALTWIVSCSSADSSIVVGSGRRWPSGEMPPST